MLKVFIISMSGVHDETLCVFCITNYNFKPKPVEKNRSIDNISAKMYIWSF